MPRVTIDGTEYVPITAQGARKDILRALIAWWLGRVPSDKDLAEHTSSYPLYVIITDCPPRGFPPEEYRIDVVAAELCRWVKKEEEP